jgi:alpha-L-fucosidase
MGDWLEKYGESIYGTRGGPYKPTDWGVSTRKDNKIYVHLLNWFGDSPQLRLPLNGAEIMNVTMLTGGRVQYEIKGNELIISVPEYSRDDTDAIILIQIEGEAMDLPVTDVKPESLSYQKSARASSESSHHFWRAGNILDGDWIGHGWKQHGKEEVPWIEIDLGEKERVTRMVIFEDGDFIESFEISAQTRKGWSVIHTGKGIGKRLDLPLDPVKSRVFRLTVKSTEGIPSIKEIVIL